MDDQKPLPELFVVFAGGVPYVRRTIAEAELFAKSVGDIVGGAPPAVHRYVPARQSGGEG